MNSDYSCKVIIADALQELWKMVVHSLEKIVVLPPLTDPRAVCLLPSLQEFTCKCLTFILATYNKPETFLLPFPWRSV